MADWTIPEGTGQKMWLTAIKLLLQQENAEADYCVVRKEEVTEKEKAGTA